MEFVLLWQLRDPLLSKFYAFPIGSSGQLLEFRNRKSYCDQPIVLARFALGAHPVTRLQESAHRHAHAAYF